MRHTSWPIPNYVSFSKDTHRVSANSDLVCLSNVRWDVEHQYPQHFLSRCVQSRRVFFIEEPVFEFIASWWLEINQRECGVWVAVPHLPRGLSAELVTAMCQSLMDELFDQYAIANPILWYCTPTAFPFTKHLCHSMVVYDRINDSLPLDDMSPSLQEFEQQLLQQADVVFKGEQSLCEAKHGFLQGTTLANVS